MFRRNSSARSKSGAFSSNRASKLSHARRRVSERFAYLNYESYMKRGHREITVARTHQWENIGRLVHYVVQLFAALSTLRISRNYVLGNPIELFEGKANKSLKASSDLQRDH